MESLRESLAPIFLKRIEKELGQEATLRLVWPLVVGSRLADNTSLKSIRGSTLIVSVPDRSWLSSLGSLDKMILDVANRLRNERAYDSIEFVEQPRMPPPLAQSRPRTGNREQETGNRPLELDVGMIADEGMRKVFLDSAKKYLARQGDCRS